MAYIKVFSRIEKPRGFAHHFIMSFRHASIEETEAYQRASDVMRATPTARWAVSEVCHGACSGLPVICDPRSIATIADRIRPPTALRPALENVYHATEYAPREVMIKLADSGYVLETRPDRWELTDAGKWAIGVEQPKPYPNSRASEDVA